WHHVNAAHDVGQAPAAERSRKRRADDERHTHRAFVDEEPMRGLVMLAQTFAVIAHDRHNGTVSQVARIEVRADASELRISKCNFSNVGAIAVPASKRLRWVVGRMWIVKMHPREEPVVRHLLEPVQPMVDDLVSRPLYRAERNRGVSREVEVVEVGVEAFVQAPLRVEHVRADERARSIAARLEELGEGRLPSIETKAAVVAHPMLRWQLSGEQRGMCWKGQRRGSRGILEEHALARQPIEIRRLDSCETIPAYTVGSGRIERDDDEVEIGGARAGHP